MLKTYSEFSQNHGSTVFNTFNEFVFHKTENKAQL